MLRIARRLLNAGLFVGVCLAALNGERAGTAAQPTQPTAADQSVPANLRELLLPPQSEMRLVAQRYVADRNTLSGNYQGGEGGGRGGGGRGGQAPDAAPAARPLSVSPNRIARLKRFDLDWQAALGRLDAAKLSAAGRTQLDALKGTIQGNLTQLEADTAAIAELAPLLPFAPRIIALYEARVRMEDVNSQEAAGELTAVKNEIAQVRARLEKGLGGTGDGDTLRVSRDLAIRGAEATDSLRASITNWFNFRNGYDPLFTWWMGLPFKHVDEGLRGYATFLRDKSAPAGQASGSPAPAVKPIPQGPAPKFSDVPDLAQIIALPQDGMIGIVQRFTPRTGGRGGGRGGDPIARDPKYYQDWLAALNTLDFDTLSRNAQVDYIFIRTSAERMIARASIPPQAVIERKSDNSGIGGDARGRVGLLQDLSDEMIPYTPEELIAIGYKELAWMEGEMKKASRQMGFGDDWKKAVEKVKTMHPPPGGKPAAVRDMLFEAIDYLRKHDMITVPQVAAESMHMSMMSPERQLINPFFTGGSQITVSFPTNTMEYEARLQSMRGNNIPFNHSTAFHEMIPGHNLVGFLGSRFSGYRASLGGTPFFGEGWPLYWEIILYDKGFHDTPEERVGAMFWRMHRAARIIFSMSFHLGLWSPQQCIDFLVDRVGHERDNATAEVRRSFESAAPLYQAAYLLGGLQIHGLRKELVDSKQLSEKAFHDEIMRQGGMPIAWLRLAVTKQRLARDASASWKFYGDVPATK
jgi:Bacterial protein of unknown function (DUF885)